MFDLPQVSHRYGADESVADVLDQGFEPVGNARAEPDKGGGCSVDQGVVGSLIAGRA
ncbi:hypothetical protein [Cryobacterium flavum]|uniref:hypothetical protein n=1 Tax=Cryobacterium flavum TaxID=1424659 RepID=UPI00135665F3|nr:hypothetical protein [Cryobacterium flavum]